MGTREVFNPATGERFWFADSDCDENGKVRALRYEILPGAIVPEHFHPATAQVFEVVSGQLHVEVSGRVQVLEAGQRARCDRGERHRQWNEGVKPAVAIESYEPPLDIEPFFTHLAKMGQRGELRAGGEPTNPIRFAVFVSDFRNITQLANPAMRTLMFALALIGRSFGMRNWYQDR